MSKRFLLTLTLILTLGLSGSLFAQQQTTPPPSDPSAQQPSQPSQQPSQQQTTPDAQSQSSPTSNGQVFTGTVTKSGDKLVLQTTDGMSYNVDDQAALKKYEGKQVRINGTLDPDGKTIHVK